MAEIPTLRLEVALELGVLDVPEEEDYTDLTERIRGFQMKRGRDDQFGTFNAGTCNFTLDNSDGTLDPQNPDGLVALDDDLGLPLCPARVTIDYDGDTWPLMARAVVGAAPWQPTNAPNGPESTVALELLDPFGAAVWVSTPASIWRRMVQLIDPEWWIPGEAIPATDVPSEGYELPSHGTTVGNATIEHLELLDPLDPPLLALGGPLTFLDVGVSRDLTNVFTNGLISATIASPSMTLKPFSLIRTEEEDIFPSGDLAEQTIYFQWQAKVSLAESDDVSTIARCATGDIDGDLRWLLKIDTENELTLKLDVYDDTGTLLTQLIADPPASGAWCDGNPHGFAIRIEGGTQVDLFADDQQITETVDVPTAAHAGIVWLGTSQDAAAYELTQPATWPSYDELIIVPRLLTDEECARFCTAPATPATFHEGVTLAERIELWYELAGWTALPDEDEEWHPPPLSIVDPDTEVQLAGLFATSTTWPETLAGALVAVADDVGGDMYALRNGKVRVRSLLAVADPDLAAVYDTIAVSLTDEPSPGGSPTPIRRGPVGFSGVRLDRVITECFVDYPIGIQGSFNAHGQTQSIGPANRYGRRRITDAVNTLNPKVAQALGDLKVDRYADPPVEVGAVTLDPLLGHDAAEQVAAVDWLVKDLELEQAVQVVDTRPGQAARTYPLQIQGESWDWSPERLTVTLNLARS